MGKKRPSADMPRAENGDERRKQQARYWRRYYLTNKARIMLKRRAKYAGDPQFREDLKQRALTAYHTRVAQEGRPPKARFKPRKPNKPLVLYPIGTFAKAVGRSAQSLSIWEAGGIIPPPTLTDAAGRRWYVPAHMKVIAKAVREFAALGGRGLSDLKAAVWSAWEKLLRTQTGPAKLAVNLMRRRPTPPGRTAAEPAPPIPPVSSDAAQTADPPAAAPTEPTSKTAQGTEHDPL